MNRSLIKFFTPVSFIFCFFIFTTNANACSCSPRIALQGTTVEDQIKDELKTFNGVIFRGEVIKIEKSNKILKATFKVKRYWKGIGKREISVVTLPALCGVTFSPKQTYILKVSGNATEYFATHCDQLDFNLHKKIYLKNLGKGKKPDKSK